MNAFTTQGMDLLPLEVHWRDISGLAIRHAFINWDAHGVPVIMTAPWPESIMAFHAIIPLLGKDRPILAVDLPGFGHSKSRLELMTPRSMGTFLLRILDTFEITTAHLIAPDIGTLAALCAAIADPDRFTSIIGGSVGTSMDLLGPSLRQVVLSNREDYADDDGGERVATRLARNIAAGVPENVLEDYRLASHGQRWNEAADYVRSYPFELPRLATALGQVLTPALFIYGQDDTIAPPRNGEFLASRLAFGTARTISAGHFVWEDAPQAYAQMVRDWMTMTELSVLL